MFFLKKTRLTDVEEKFSTYLSIICYKDKIKTKLTSFAITIFSTIIFSVQKFWWLSIFLPLYLIVHCKSSKFCTNFDLFEFGKLRRCSSTIWSKNCFCSSSVVMLLLKDCIKATPRSGASLVTFSLRTIDNPFRKPCKNAVKMLKSGFVLHFHTRRAPTARFGLSYRNILLPCLVVREIDWSKRTKFSGETRNER